MKQDAVPEIDVRIHEPVRLRILALLASVEQADFMFILRQTGTSRGNLSVQMTRLEEAGIVHVSRDFDGRRARTVYSLTADGIQALSDYRRSMSTLLAALPAEKEERR